jgi:hypothetical protein
MRFLPLLSKIIRLSPIRVGIGWMFALLTFNFNRVSIVDLGAMGLIVAKLIGLHHFLSPFQVFWGRLADRYSLAGYRRTPYIVLSTLVGSLIFLALPSLAVGLGHGAPEAIALAFGLLVLFGLAMAANGIASRLRPLSKKLLATTGGIGAGMGMGLVAVCSATQTEALLHPALPLVGMFNVGANVLGGGLHTALIETHLLRPDAAYGLIFGFEALLMIAAVVVLRSISMQEFKGLETNDLTSVMALDTAA